MHFWTLITDADEIALTVHLTENKVYQALRKNFDPEGEFAHLDNDALIDELTQRQGVVLYIEEHDLAAELPRDEDGNIVTSTDFGEARLVKVEYNTDYDGREIDPGKEDYPATFHGPFKDYAEAQTWADAYGPDSTDIHDVLIIPLNLVRPA